MANEESPIWIETRGERNTPKICSICGIIPRINMKKEHLPEKICPACNRPFRWRKKWEKVWEEVKYCSDRCRMNKNRKTHTA